MAKGLDLKVTLAAVNKTTGPLKQILKGSRGVSRAMKETRGELREFSEQQKRIGAFRDMTRQSQETRQALREKREALDRLTREIETASGPTKRLTQQQAKARKAVEKLSGDYRAQRDRVRELSRDLPPATDGTRGLGRQQAALEEKIRATNERLSKQREALARLGDADVAGRFSKMNGELARLGRRTAMLGGAAAGGIFALANSTATLGDDVAKTAAKIGISNQALQELRYGAERSGLSTKKLDSSMERFVKRLGEARQGSGAAAKAYEQLGLDAGQLAKLTPTEALARVADELGNVENHTDRVALMAKFFGREGVAMINMLKDGSKGLNRFAGDARGVGYVLGEQAPAEAEAFKDALLDTQSGLKGMKNTIGAELMPVVTDLMKELSGGMRDNQGAVKSFAKSFGENLKAAVPVIRDLAKGAGRVAKQLGIVIDNVSKLVGGYDNLAMIAGGLFASKALWSVISFAVGIGKAAGAIGAFAKTLPLVSGAIKTLGIAFAATPIGWLIAGIAAVAGAAYWIYNNWDWIGPWFTELWDGIKAKASAVWEWMKSAPAAAGKAVSDWFMNWTLPGLLIKHWDEIKASGAKLWDWFKDAPSNAIEAVKNMLADWDLKGIIKEKWDAAISYLKDLPGNMKDAGIDAAKGLGEGIKSGAGNAWSAVKNFALGTEETARHQLQTRSPSKVFRDIGGDVTDGLAMGIHRNRDDPASETRDMVSRLRQAGGGLVLGTAALASAGAVAADTAPMGAPSFDARPPLSAPSAGGSGPLIGQLNINVESKPGMDEQALARYVATEVQRALASAERDAAARRRSAFHDID